MKKVAPFPDRFQSDKRISGFTLISKQRRSAILEAIVENKISTYSQFLHLNDQDPNFIFFTYLFVSNYSLSLFPSIFPNVTQ